MSKPIDQNLRKLLAPELQKGEKLLWAGKPSGLPIDGFDVFGILLYGFVSFYLVGFFGVYGDLFSQNNKLLGSFIRLAPVFTGFQVLYIILRLLLRTRDIYAITSERVILQTYIFQRSFRDVEGFKDIKQSASVQNSTITFIPQGYSLWDVFWSNWEGVNLFRRAIFYRKEALDKFFNIENFEFVSSLIHKLFLQAEDNEEPGFKTSRSARRRRRSIINR